MKHLLPYLLATPLLLATNVSSAQTRPSGHSKGQMEAEEEPVGHLAMLRFGIGSSTNGSGDYALLKAHLEYGQQLGRHWRVGSRLAYVGNSHDYKLRDGAREFNVPQSYRGVNAEQELHWLPFGAGRTVEFGVGGGVYAGYAKHIGFTQAGYGLDADGNREFTYTARKEQGFHVGYIASLYVDFALDQKAEWRLGGRLALQNDTRRNIMPGGQLQVSRAL